eukprot:SAG22_NODE_14066_length_386_cov_0.550523_1_plen_34_part_01
MSAAFKILAAAAAAAAPEDRFPGASWETATPEQV